MGGNLTRNSLRQKVMATPSSACSCWKSSCPMLISVTMALMVLSVGAGARGTWAHGSQLLPPRHSLSQASASSLTCLFLLVASQDNPATMANAQCHFSQCRGEG